MLAAILALVSVALGFMLGYRVANRRSQSR